MMTGLLTPTAGEAFVYGLSIREGNFPASSSFPSFCGNDFGIEHPLSEKTSTFLCCLKASDVFAVAEMAEIQEIMGVCPQACFLIPSIFRPPPSPV